MDWNDLAYFLAVARHGSTLAASRELGVNQTTIGRRISALETSLGLQLFDRLPTGYRTTETGRKLVPLALRIEEQVQEITREAEREKRHLSGTIRVTTSDVLARLVMMPVIGRFSETFPNTQAQVIVTDRQLDLLEGEADLALRVGGAPEQASLIARRLIAARWGLYCSERYAQRRGLPQTLEDLEGHAVLGFDGELDRTAIGDWLRETLPERGFAARSNTLLSHLDAIRTGLGVGPLPRIEGDRHEDLLLCTDRVDCAEQSLWLLMHPETRRQPHIRAFADDLVAYVMSLRAAFEGR